MTLEEERREYRFASLTRDQLAASPFDQFRVWMDDAHRAQVQDPTAMCLATVDGDGRPSQRIVLLKHFDEDGLVFYTNLESRKSVEITGNSRVSLHFAWLELDRQVHVEGAAAKLSLGTVLKYFMSRPRDSQLAAWASHQSRKLSSRQILEDEFMRMKQKYASSEIPVPSFWGGYQVTPDAWEFWQGRENRLHDRFQYAPDGGHAWTVARVAP